MTRCFDLSGISSCSDMDLASPREHLMRAVSAEDVSDEELLAVLLGTGTCGCTVMELAHRMSMALRQAFDSPKSPCDWRSLASMIDAYNRANPRCRINGVGEVKLLQLAAAFELANRRYRRYEHDQFARTLLRSSQAAFTLFEKVLARHPEQEQFYTLLMDSGSHPLCAPILVAKGGVGSVSVHPREVFCEAIRWRAYAVIVAHNHPSGDPSPSQQDIELTKSLLSVSKLVHIPLIDHLVIARDRFVSLRGNGELSFA